MIPRVKIYQGGSDGFGHQFEGTLRLLSLSLNGKADYQYKYKKQFAFEHNNIHVDTLVNYITHGLDILSKHNSDNSTDTIPNQTRNESVRTFQQIQSHDPDYSNYIYTYDGVGCGRWLPPNFEHKSELAKSLPLLREAFVLQNPYLPPFTYDRTRINVCCHIRLGDAVGQRVLDTETLMKVIRVFQREVNTYRIIVHSDGDMSSLASENTIIRDRNVDVLEVLSDFIHADILVLNYSSLSIAAHLLANEKQSVIVPDKVGVTFPYRVLDKCISSTHFLVSNLMG